MVINNLSNTALAQGSQPSKAMLWTGRISWVLAVPFLLFDVAIHIANPPFVQEATKEYGMNPAHVPIIGLIQLVCMALYLIPRTAVLGAVLMTGYLGGAVYAHMALNNFGFFAVIMGALLWISLYCRDARVRALA